MQIRSAQEIWKTALGELQIAVSKQNPKHEQIARDFDKAIEKMNADETLIKIIQRHKSESPALRP